MLIPQKAAHISKKSTTHKSKNVVWAQHMLKHLNNKLTLIDSQCCFLSSKKQRKNCTWRWSKKYLIPAQTHNAEWSCVAQRHRRIFTCAVKQWPRRKRGRYRFEEQDRLTTFAADIQGRALTTTGFRFSAKHSPNDTAEITALRIVTTVGCMKGWNKQGIIVFSNGGVSDGNGDSGIAGFDLAERKDWAE